MKNNLWTQSTQLNIGETEPKVNILFTAFQMSGLLAARAMQSKKCQTLGSLRKSANIRQRMP